jgi:hypothetical protein
MGGPLFDPNRFPFLEGRLKETSWRQHRTEPLPIDDRTVLLLLEASQTFEGRTLSYCALDVEQIGHIYEGLLERTVERVADITLELEAAAQAKDPRVTLGELESAVSTAKLASPVCSAIAQVVLSRRFAMLLERMSSPRTVPPPAGSAAGGRRRMEHRVRQPAQKCRRPDRGVDVAMTDQL